MKAKDILRELDDFETLLRELDRQRRSLVGEVEDSDWESRSLASTQERAHYAFDDVRLGLLRKYRTLRPFLKNLSQCFYTALTDDGDSVEIYEFFIHRGVGNLDVLYEDLKIIRQRLETFDTETELSEKGAP